MDSAPPPHSDMPAPPPGHAPDARQLAARTEALLDALKTALAIPGEHRLFRSGKLSGLFPTRVGVSADASLFAIQQGLLETLRTEVRGKVVTEWVKATPKAVEYVHDNDSSRAVLRELRSVLAATKSGIPAWLDEARKDLDTLSARFESRTATILKGLEDLTQRVEAALRRAEMSSPSVPQAIAEVVPWAAEALEYLDRRASAGSPTQCTLQELFQALTAKHSSLKLSDYQDGLRRLNDIRAVRLLGDTMSAVSEPEFALVVEGQIVDRVMR